MTRFRILSQHFPKGLMTTMKNVRQDRVLAKVWTSYALPECKWGINTWATLSSRKRTIFRHVCKTV